MAPAQGATGVNVDDMYQFNLSLNQLLLGIGKDEHSPSRELSAMFKIGYGWGLASSY